MTQLHPTAAPRSLERMGFTGLVVLTLAPLVLQGIWRPLARAAHASADSLALTCLAVLVAAVACAVTFMAVTRRWLAVASSSLVAVSLSALLGWPSFTAAAISLVAVAVCSCALARWLAGRLPTELDGLAARRRGVAAWMLLLGALTITQTTRLGVYLGDATRPEMSLLPTEPFFVTHSCLSAYVEGARLAGDRVANLYDVDGWPSLSDSARATAAGAPYAPFVLDAYAYPPPFLLLPRALLSPFGDFASQRAVWFTFNGLFVAAALWLVAAWVGGRAGLRALLLAPLLWLSPPLLATLQVGNAHALVLAAAMLALVAFEKKRPAVGGALLAFAVVSKLSPGLLVIWLLAQRRFREVAWTAAWTAGFSVAALAAFGPAPFAAFVTYELPRLDSGEALRFLAGPESVPINLAPFGLPFKLAALGVDVGDLWRAARRFNQVFTLIIVALTVVAARRHGDRRHTAVVWAAILTLASLRSPLAPGYITIALLWVFSLRAVEVRGWAQTALAVALWASVAITLPGASKTVLVVSMVQQSLIIGLAAYFCARRVPVGAA